MMDFEVEPHLWSMQVQASAPDTWGSRAAVELCFTRRESRFITGVIAKVKTPASQRVAHTTLLPPAATAAGPADASFVLAVEDPVQAPGSALDDLLASFADLGVVDRNGGGLLAGLLGDLALNGLPCLVVAGQDTNFAESNIVRPGFACLTGVGYVPYGNSIVQRVRTDPDPSCETRLCDLTYLVLAGKQPAAGRVRSRTMTRNNPDCARGRAPCPVLCALAGAFVVSSPGLTPHRCIRRAPSSAAAGQDRLDVLASSSDGTAVSVTAALPSVVIDPATIMVAPGLFAIHREDKARKAGLRATLQLALVERQLEFVALFSLLENGALYLTGALASGAPWTG